MGTSSIAIIINGTYISAKLLINLILKISAKVSNNKSRKAFILRDLFYVLIILAEREGFEPPVPYSTTVFKTAGLNRSPISPFRGGKYTKNIIALLYGINIL